MRRLLIATGVLFLLAAPRVPAHAAQATVNFNDSVFSPYSVTISAGDDVFWCPNSDNQLTHNITADDGTFKSPEIPPHSGCTWMTFQRDGRFPYHCTHVQGMAGVIQVGNSAPPTTATTAKASTPTTARPSTATTARRSTATTRRVAAASSTTAVSTTAPDESTTAFTRGDGDTTTTAAQVAIKEASHRGSSRGGRVALGVLLMAVALGAGGYAYYRGSRSAR